MVKFKFNIKFMRHLSPKSNFKSGSKSESSLDVGLSLANFIFKMTTKLTRNTSL